MSQVLGQAKVVISFSNCFFWLLYNNDNLSFNFVWSVHGPVYKLKVEFRNQFSYNISQQQRKRNLEWFLGKF